jgi:hypothetical protein
MLAERKAPGDTEKARELLTKAHSTAEANGMGKLSVALRQHPNCWTPNERGVASPFGIAALSLRRALMQTARCGFCAP